MHLVQAIIMHTAVVFGHSPADILGRSRKQPIVEARQAAMWAVRQRYPSIPLTTIGASIGNRHYTTVMHALTAAEDRALANPAYRIQLERLLKRIAAPPIPIKEPHRVSHYSPAWRHHAEPQVSQS